MTFRSTQSQNGFGKVRFYIFYVSAANARYNIIFASIDRYLCSSSNFRLRQWSSPQKSLYVLSSVVPFSGCSFTYRYLFSLDFKVAMQRYSDEYCEVFEGNTLQSKMDYFQYFDPAVRIAYRP